MIRIHQVESSPQTWPCDTSSGVKLLKVNFLKKSGIPTHTSEALQPRGATWLCSWAAVVERWLLKLPGAPGGVWVQQTMDRPEPERETQTAITKPGSRQFHQRQSTKTGNLSRHQRATPSADSAIVDRWTHMQNDDVGKEPKAFIAAGDGQAGPSHHPNLTDPGVLPGRILLR